ncbi:malonate transporter, MadM subunit [Emticicia oligotrophica DSM 17448]|uniref:Malonate transporter, MadM subunit n=1 Tax=Emticicia oligotrophica (strain DSM 17448 / CIP 109782 / MTCC 6937 / GPTSA100-15) TaxID=929562 RepID=A0ABM5MXF5_EMTOG|nr:malonate transporter subunit MadM [Emticicia oligotrophica]AFK01774.1 malonate transporter, MadM subunit [Emticicia oligotrophica DSM 17448]
MEIIVKFFEKNGLIIAFLSVGIITYISGVFSDKLTRKKIPASAIAILIGLVLAYVGGIYTKGEKGLADIKIFSGFGMMGGSMLRDFAIVSTAMGASFVIMKRTGWVGALSLFLGIVLSFISGVIVGLFGGYTDAISLSTIGAGACTYIVGPVTGAAIGANSDVIALSIAAGVVKAIAVTIGTPFIAKYIGLNSPHTAMVFGGLMGTTSGVTAGLAATDPKLVPYGALTATFYTGLGCLFCPSVLFLLMKLIFG